MKRGPGRTGEPGRSPEATRRLRAKARPPETSERVPHWWADSEDNFAIGVYFDGEGEASTTPKKKTPPG